MAPVCRRRFPPIPSCFHSFLFPKKSLGRNSARVHLVRTYVVRVIVLPYYIFSLLDLPTSYIELYNTMVYCKKMPAHFPAILLTVFLSFDAPFTEALNFAVWKEYSFFWKRIAKAAAAAAAYFCCFWAADRSCHVSPVSQSSQSVFATQRLWRSRSNK